MAVKVSDTVNPVAGDGDEQPCLSVVIPVYNEENVVGETVSDVARYLRSHTPAVSFEIIVIDDGSTDASADAVDNLKDDAIRLVSHPYNIGNGAAIKTGIREATGDYILMMDADGQHAADDIGRFLELAPKYHMVVGARKNKRDSAWHRNLANSIYNLLSTYISGRKIEDLTSGFRLVRASLGKNMAFLLPNSFSYPTTLTLSILRAGYSLKYIPIDARKRVGKSKIRLLVDGTRFLMILLRIAVFFAPLRIFVPLSLVMFAGGLSWYLYRHFILDLGFPPVSSLLMISAIIVFSLGLISEQIANLRLQRQ